MSHKPALKTDRHDKLVGPHSQCHRDCANTHLNGYGEGNDRVITGAGRVRMDRVDTLRAEDHVATLTEEQFLRGMG